jgi:hypothetical protein
VGGGKRYCGENSSAYNQDQNQTCVRYIDEDFPPFLVNSGLDMPKKHTGIKNPHHIIFTVPATKYFIATLRDRVTHDNLCDAREPEKQCI